MNMAMDTSRSRGERTNTDADKLDGNQTDEANVKSGLTTCRTDLAGKIENDVVEDK